MARPIRLPGVPEYDDDDQQLGGMPQGQAPQIARPNSGPRPISLPGPSPEQQHDQAMLDAAKSSQPGISKIHNRFLRGLATVGDIAGSTLVPTVAENIPGTTQHHKLQVKTAEDNLNQDVARGQKAAETAEQTARAQAIAQPQPKVGLTPEESTIHDLMTGENGQARVNPETGQPYTYLEAYSAVKQAAGEAKPSKKKAAHITYDSGIPVSVVDEDENVYDVNDPKLPPKLKPLVDAANRAHGTHVSEAANAAATANANQNQRQQNTETFQMQEKGREHIQKNESDYNDAAEKAETLRGVVRAAQGGNMVAGSVQPLLAVLGLTTMEGVKRINNTELQNVAGAGSLMDKIRGRIGAIKEGQPLDPALQKDIADLADLLQKGAYQKYKTNHARTKQRYQLDDEEPLPDPFAQQGGSQGPPAGAKVRDYSQVK